MGNDKNLRQHPRKGYKLKLGLNTTHNFYTGFTGNISEGGLFIATEAPLEIGRTISLRFTLPNSALEIQVDGEVRWVKDSFAAGANSLPGMGIRFINLDAKSRKLIEDFVEKREPEFYPED